MKSNIVEFPERKARYVTIDIVDLIPRYMFMRPDGTHYDPSADFRAALKKSIRGIPQSGAEIINIKEK